jgi:hypothetical protein
MLYPLSYGSIVVWSSRSDLATARLARIVVTVVFEAVPAWPRRAVGANAKGTGDSRPPVRWHGL